MKKYLSISMLFGVLLSFGQHIYSMKSYYDVGNPNTYKGNPVDEHNLLKLDYDTIPEATRKKIRDFYTQNQGFYKSVVAQDVDTEKRVSLFLLKEPAHVVSQVLSEIGKGNRNLMLGGLPGLKLDMVQTKLGDLPKLHDGLAQKKFNDNNVVAMFARPKKGVYYSMKLSEIKTLPFLNEKASSLTARHNKAVEALKKQRVELLSGGAGANYIFTSPADEKYVTKVSGPVNRMMLRLSAQDVPYGRFDLYNSTRDKLLATYHTAHRHFHKLRLLEAKKKFNLKRLSFPQSGLVCVNPDKTDSCADKDVVFVQRRLDGRFKRLSDYLQGGDLGAILDKEALEHLMIAVKYAGLFDISGNNILVMPPSKKFNNYKLIIIDAEGPNSLVRNDEVDQYFNKAHEQFGLDTNNKQDCRYGHSIVSGMMGIYNMLPKGSKQRDWVEEFCHKDEDILRAYNKDDLLKRFDDNKK